MQHQSRIPSWMPTALMTVSAVLLLCLFPLYNDFSYSRITHAKWVCMLCLTAVILGLFLLSLLCCLLQRPRRRAPLTVVQGLAAAYFLWAGLSALLGRMAGTVNKNGELAVWMGALRYEGMATQLCYAAIFLCMSFFPPRMAWLLHGASIALLAFCAVVVLQYADMNPLGLFPESRSVRTNYEFQGTIGNIDMVSGYLTLVVPLLIIGFICGSRRWDAVWLTAGMAGMLLELCMTVQSGLLAMGLMLLLSVLLMLTQPQLRFRGFLVLSGACLMAAIRLALRFPWLDDVANVIFTPGISSLILLLYAAGLSVIALIVRRPSGNALRPRTVLIAAALLMLALLLMMAILPIPEHLGGLYELHEVLNGRGQDSYGSNRLGVWRLSLLMSRKSLLFGTGPDTFFYAFREQLTESGVTLPQSFDTPHNEYVSILCNNGLPALMLYLIFLFSLIRRGLRRCHRPYVLPCLAGVICFAAQGFFSFSICLVTPMFWALLGMLHSLTTRASGGQGFHPCTRTRAVPLTPARLRARRGDGAKNKALLQA